MVIEAAHHRTSKGLHQPHQGHIFSDSTYARGCLEEYRSAGVNSHLAEHIGELIDNSPIQMVNPLGQKAVPLAVLQLPVWDISTPNIILRPYDNELRSAQEWFQTLHNHQWSHCLCSTSRTLKPRGRWWGSLCPLLFYYCFNTIH